MQKNTFTITDDGKVICRKDARVSVREILFVYLKMKASLILFILIMAYLVHEAVVRINEIPIKLGMLSFVIFSIFLFWFLNKKPKQILN